MTANYTIHRDPPNVRPSSPVVKAKLKEVARRYTKQPRDKLTLIATLRVRDLITIAERKFGSIPDTRDGWAWLEAFAVHVAYAFRHRPHRGRTVADGHLRQLAPFLAADERDALIEDASRTDARDGRLLDRLIVPFPNMDKLGASLGITIDQRDAWCLTNIGAIGDSPAKRKARQKIRRKAKAAAKRAAKGAVPRSKSKARTQPWLALNMSRRTWYRRGQPASATGKQIPTETMVPFPPHGGVATVCARQYKKRVVGDESVPREHAA